nr:MAG TPA: hypothetical protein [Bacteriophage sp.]
MSAHKFFKIILPYFYILECESQSHFRHYISNFLIF